MSLAHVHRENRSPQNQQAESFFWIHTGRHALVRLLFRSETVPDLRERLCLIAGKLLQKKEVCNKAGAYASKQQRSDVNQEYNNVVLEFRDWCSQRSIVPKLLRELQDEKTWVYLVIDHTAVPVTFGHMYAPALDPRSQVEAKVSVNCPECAHAFEVPVSASAGIARTTAGAKRLRGRDE